MSKVSLRKRWPHGPGLTDLRSRDESVFIDRITDLLSRATSPHKIASYRRRLSNAQARLLYLKLQNA